MIVMTGMYYKTTILANLAFDRIVNYELKVCCKLKHTFTIVNYDRETFIVHAMMPQVALASLLTETVGFIPIQGMFIR
jgi:hypothetical protein